MQRNLDFDSDAKSDSETDMIWTDEIFCLMSW